MSAVQGYRAAGYGVLWGVAVTAMESLELPLGSLSPEDLLFFHAKLLPHECASGILLAAVVMITADRPMNRWLAAWTLVLFPLTTVVLTWATDRALGFRGFWATDGGSSQLHTYWTSMAYGTLFTVAYRLSVRAERIRALRAQAEIARQQALALLTASQFQALQGHVDPSFLLRVIEAVQARYGESPAGADRLLERLASFLRAAMPGIRSGASTLAAEAELANRYSDVLRELDGEGPAFRIHIEGDLPEIPFPSLLMLPVLDQLAAHARAPQVDIKIVACGYLCKVTLHASGLPASWLPAELMYRLQVGLRALFGDGWALTLSSDPHLPALALTLALRRRPTVPLMTPPEISYG